MHIITVIPIAKGIIKDYLSYFSSESISLGSLIQVPVRNKITNALVISSEKAENLKTTIRQASFEIKKIDNPKPRQCFSTYFLETIHRLSSYYVATPGSLLHALVPQPILQSIQKIESGQHTPQKKSIHEKLILQQETSQRLSTYKSLIREEFARKTSVYIVVPTTEDALFLSSELSKGVEQYSYTLGSFLSKQKLIKAWNALATEKHPVLIIGTGHFFSLPRNDIRTIIIEKESSPFYKTIQRPLLDIRKVAETFAETHGVKLILGDLLLSLETMWRFNQGELSELAPLQLRLAHTAKIIISDERTDPQPLSSNIKYDHTKALSDKTLSLIAHAQENNKRIFIFAHRKGSAPATYCGDCGTQVICATCSSPLVLYERTHGNRFICNRCGNSRDAKETCVRCGSWNLGTYGIGGDKIYKELISAFPSLNILRVDSEHTKTRKDIVKTINEFYSKKSNILVGTDLALHYLHTQFEYAIIPSIDGMFAIPDFKAHERVCGTLGLIASLSSDLVLIQTRMADHKIFSYIQSGNVSEFYREEIQERKRWGYPPFFVFIKITCAGNKEEARKILSPIKELLTHYESDIFTSSILDSKGKTLTHLLIRIPRNSWPDENVVAILKTLPPYCALRVNPDQII